uniref:cytoskeleton-associated protein 2-like isoform X2 n=1 Tax=Scatophagus argus TaxID=75038 RepID=UPI001ED80C11|nr:cytoskeleton-associated protein 2-like isoform X2 [Scatophagus argus]
MEEGETVSILSRKELRKQKLMEYLAAKGKLKQPNPKSYLRDDCQMRKPVMSARKVDAGKENKPPPNRCSYECPKVPTLVAKSTVHPAKGVFSVNDRVKVKGSFLTGQQNTNCASANGGPAQLKLNQNPVLTRRYTVASSNLKAGSHLKKQPDSGIQTSGRASSNATRTAVTKSNNRFNSGSNAAWSCPIDTASVRMSLGPIVKTRTGLIPAVTQPRNGQIQNKTRTSATAVDTTAMTSVSNKARSNTFSAVSVSKRSSLAQRKTLPSTVLNSQVNERITGSLSARAGNKVQDQNMSNSKLRFGKQPQPSCKSQLSGRLKSISTSTKCTAETVKPEGRVGKSGTNKLDGQSADRSTKQRSEHEGKKNGKHWKVAPQKPSASESRCSSKAMSRVMGAAVAELGGKSKTCKETDGEKGHNSAKAPPLQTGIKRTGAPVMSQTEPRPVRTVNHTGQTTDMKKTKIPVRVIPQTEGKKRTAAQEERMKRLQEWRESKGISYKRPPMPVKPQVRRTVSVLQPFWDTMKEEDEAHSLICAMDRSLADCIKLLREGCSPDRVKAVLSRLPAVSQKFAKYWICQARLMEQEGNLDVLPMFEKAVGVVLEPVDELRTVVFEILKKRDETQEKDQSPAAERTPESVNNTLMTPKPVRALICGEKGGSSVVKYKITATPGGPQSQQKQRARVNGQEVRFFTPVRRSVRIERASLLYPASLQDHDLCVASYGDLISKEDKERSEEQKGWETSPSPNNTPMYVYRENEALKDKVSVQLVCDEGF